MSNSTPVFHITSMLLKISFGLGLCILLLTSCAQRGPKTQYYALKYTQDSEAEPQSVEAESVTRFKSSGRQFGVGVGPFRLPEYLNNIGIVSHTENARLKVSSYHAWAGDLSANMLRVVAFKLSDSLALDQVWPFPWDNRARPKYQLRVVFNEFAGKRSGPVYLQATWVLLSRKGDQVLLSGKEDIQVDSKGSSIVNYTNALNESLLIFSDSLATQLANYFNEQPS